MNNTQSTDLIFDISKPGRRCHRLPACDVIDWTAPTGVTQ
jgi:glycine dehydrogenase subunit 2